MGKEIKKESTSHHEKSYHVMFMVKVFVINVVIVIFKGVSIVSQGGDGTVLNSSKDTFDEYIWATEFSRLKVYFGFGEEGALGW